MAMNLVCIGMMLAGMIKQNNNSESAAAIPGAKFAPGSSGCAGL
jgi:hypothetical protein